MKRVEKSKEPLSFQRKASIIKTELFIMKRGEEYGGTGHRIPEQRHHK